MSYSPKHPSSDTSGAKKPSTSSKKKNQKTVITIILVVLALVVVAALIFIFVPGAENGIGRLFSGNQSQYVPETQDGTTIISQYYQNGILPTSGNRHDVEVIKGGGRNASEVEGIWSLDGNTVYEFDGRGRGIMLTAVDNYTFVYSAENGDLVVDFDIDDAMDARYTYTVSGDTLTLSRGGQEYKFTKKAS